MFKIAANISFNFGSGDEDDPKDNFDQSDNSFKASPMHNVFSDE